MNLIGLIVNPIAGLGGRVGLKGSDGLAIQHKAIELGGLPKAGDRATQALRVLLAHASKLELLTYPTSMGAEAARQAGINPRVIGSTKQDQTSAEDTVRAAGEMKENKVGLILFAGGDGTARDIYNAIGMSVPALGIPAGVKIHSAVFATTPPRAGELAAGFLQGKADLGQAEVMDLDEDAFRGGQVSPRLYGYLKIPYLQHYLQSFKAPSPLGESAVLEAIAEEVAERIRPGWLYIFGPGSTTHAVAAHLGLDKTLLGVDAVLDGKIVAADASESDLLQLLSTSHPAEIVVTPIGGQGCIFGRGNQPISPEVIKRIGRTHIHVISTPEKIRGFRGRPLWVDTGEPRVDKMLSGYFPVITGYKERVMYKVVA